ncbi:MAG: DUF126 domain-containing protein [Rhizobiaceae bacterium]
MNGHGTAEILVRGEAEAEVLALDEPLSFSGGLDLSRGMIIDKWHPQHGVVLSGRILSMESGRGSSSGAAVLAEALRKGIGPCGILLSQRDGIVSAGAIIANDLYNLRCPVVCLPSDERTAIRTADRIRIDASGSAATIVVK